MKKFAVLKGVTKKRKAAELIAKAAFNIKQYRMRAGLTQEQLEDRTRVTISRCETGKYDITLTTLSIISKALKVEAYELLK